MGGKEGARASGDPGPRGEPCSLPRGQLLPCSCSPHPQGMDTELAAVLTLLVRGLCALAAVDRPIMLRVRTLSGVSSFPREHPLSSSCADPSEGQSGI